MAEYTGSSTRPSKGPGSGNRSRRSANRKARAIETQAVESRSNGEYGRRTDEEAAQSAIPLPKVDLAGALAAATAEAPPEGGLAAPSGRPNEPVTAGLRGGPGPGPEMLAQGVGGNPDIEMVRALYRQFPTEAVRRVLERLDREVGPDRALAPMGRGFIPPTSGMVQESKAAGSLGAATGRAAAVGSGSPEPERRKGGRSAPGARSDTAAGGLYQNTDG